MSLSDILIIEPWWRFAAAALIGALVGLEREHVAQVEDERTFAGIRTFSLMGLLGGLAGYVSAERGAAYFLVPYAALALLVLAGYLGSLRAKQRATGTTTEVAALIVPLLGAMIVWDEAEIGLALGVITALVLAFKDWLHAVARRMSHADLLATLQFALMALVILPLLPNRSLGPMDVWNPFEVWLMVVLVSGISFLGYVLMKARGASQGVEIAGLLGGLVSSTATTVSLAGRSKKSPGISDALALGVTIASCVMLVRVLAEAAIVHSPLVLELGATVGAMLATGLLAYGWMRRRTASGEAEEGRLELGNPLRIRLALGFGAIYAVVLLVLRFAESNLGAAGLYAASAVAGLTDVDAVTLSAANLARGGQLAEDTAAVAIAIAAVANTIAKGGFALALGAPALRRPVALAFGAMAAVGVLAIALQAL